MEKHDLLIANDSPQALEYLVMIANRYGKEFISETLQAEQAEEAVQIIQEQAPRFQLIDCHFDERGTDQQGICIIQRSRRIEQEDSRRTRAYIALVTASLREGYEKCMEAARQAGADAAVMTHHSVSQRRQGYFETLFGHMRKYKGESPDDFLSLPSLS